MIQADRVVSGATAARDGEVLSYRLRAPVAAIVAGERDAIAVVYLWREPLTPHRDQPCAESRPVLIRLARAGYAAVQRITPADGSPPLAPQLARIDGGGEWNGGRLEFVVPASCAARTAFLVSECWDRAERIEELNGLIDYIEAL